jgi:hypothetical protein
VCPLPLTVRGIFGGEFDELQGKVGKTRTLVINVEDLENPSNVQEYLGRTTAIHHNLYVAEHQGTDYIYQANYRAGLQILRVIDWETADFVEAGHFDTYPADDLNDFGGAWSVYPFFRSGLLAVSSIEEGLFLVRSSELKYEAPTAQPTTSPTARVVVDEPTGDVPGDEVAREPVEEDEPEDPTTDGTGGASVTAAAVVLVLGLLA